MIVQTLLKYWVSEMPHEKDPFLIIGLNISTSELTIYPIVHYDMSALIHGLDCVFWYGLYFFLLMDMLIFISDGQYERVIL
jgi:hypothetical protein